jgi:hypothetical protein
MRRLKSIDRKRAFAGKVEGIYNGKEEGSFEEEGKQSVEKGGLSRAVRKLMGRGVNREDVWEEEDGLVVGELGRRMVAEEWSMGEEALAKERRVTRRESTTFARGSKNSIAPDLSQIQPFPSYFDSSALPPIFTRLTSV